MITLDGTKYTFRVTLTGRTILQVYVNHPLGGPRAQDATLGQTVEFIKAIERLKKDS